MINKIFWELLLIVAAIPVFRAAWIFLDNVDWLNENSGLLFSLIVGLALNFFALFMLHRK